MESALTIRLDKNLNRLLKKTTKKTGRNQSELVRDALRRQLSIFLFDEIRDKTVPFGQTQGYLTDEDVFRDIS